MRQTWLAAFALPFLLILAPVLRAGEKTADAPTVVVRAKSLNALLQNVNLVVKLIGQEEAAVQIEGLVKARIGKKGLEGIDPSRPFGVYLRFGKAIDEIHGAILIPIADEKTFLTLLENLNVNYTKDKAGIYTHKTKQNVDLFFRFANNYLYVTAVNTESLQDKNLIDPAKALAISGDATISAVARLEQIPNDIKLIALGQLEEKIEAIKKDIPSNELKSSFGDVHKFAKAILNEASEVRFDLDISDKTKEMTVNFKITPKQGSGLATTIKTMGDLKSPLSGIVKNNLAFQGDVHLVLPDALKKALGHALEEVEQNGLKGIQDKDKRAQAKMLFDAMMPTARSGELQIVTAVIGPDAERFTFLAAVKLKDGDKLGKTAHKLLEEALQAIPADQRGKYKLDFDRVGSVMIHKFEMPKDPKLNKFIDDVAGDNQLYLAFRDDAMFLALGKQSLATLKTALAKNDSAASPAFLFDFDVARMAPLMAQTPEQKALAEKLFPMGENGRIRLVIEGGPTLNTRLQIRLNVLEFLVKLKKDME